MQDIEQSKKDFAEGRFYTHKQMLEELGIEEEIWRVFTYR